MGGRINCYLDVASLYSYVAFALLLKDLDKLATHGVEVEFHPVLLGAINRSTGNNPPWVLPARARYLLLDSRRSCERAGKPEVRSPRDLMPMGKTVLPNRALHYIKQTYPQKTFLTALHYFFHCFWTPPNLNISLPDVFAKVLAEVPLDFGGAEGGSYEASRPLFSSDEVAKIIAAANSQPVKDLLTKTTQAALDRGAFGNPWIWVRNGAGEEEPFFGSDRFHFVYKFLDLPYQDVALLPAGSGRSEAKL